MSQNVIVIGGTTASGKSALALDLAQAFNGVVINADSMQVYRGLPVLSAVPTREDRGRVCHRLYEIYPPQINGTVVDWLERAGREIRRAWAENFVPVVVGGTGLYVDNLINGTTPIPEPDPGLRKKILQMAKKEGVSGLYARLHVSDPVGAALVSPKDLTRVRRAYEVWCQTKKSIAEWYQMPMIKALPEAKFTVIKIIPPAEELDQRCYHRFDLMMQNGALEEVKHLAEQKIDRNLPAMKMLGVPELLEYLEDRCSLENAVELAKLHTRQYAKRQRTWFKNKLQADVTLEEIYDGSENMKNRIYEQIKPRLLSEAG